MKETHSYTKHTLNPKPKIKIFNQLYIYTDICIYNKRNYGLMELLLIN